MTATQRPSPNPSIYLCAKRPKVTHCITIGLKSGIRLGHPKPSFWFVWSLERLDLLLCPTSFSCCIVLCLILRARTDGLTFFVTQNLHFGLFDTLRGWTCFYGSFSCCIALSLSFRAWNDGLTLVCRIFWWTAELFVPVDAASCLGPEVAFENITMPPPCITVGIILFLSNAVLFYVKWNWLYDFQIVQVLSYQSVSPPPKVSGIRWTFVFFPSEFSHGGHFCTVSFLWFSAQ